MHTLTEQALDGLTAMHDVHKETFEFLVKARTEANRGGMKAEDMVDLAFVLKRLGELHEDLRKELSRLEGTLDSAACARWVVTAGVTGEHNIKGELCTGTPEVTEMPRIPPRDHPDYAKLMAYIGVEPKAMEMMRLHWPTMQAHIDTLAAAGKPLPPGLAGWPTITQSVVRKTPLRSAKKLAPK